MDSKLVRIDNLSCLCCRNEASPRVAYVLYPMEVPAATAMQLAQAHGVSVAIITGMDWDNDLTPWPAPGVPAGSPAFKGLAPQFLARLTATVVPAIEQALGLSGKEERTLVGVSLSGLFTLWQWPLSDFFTNIATLSGSYWYEGFAAWVERQSFADKKGRCFMLLGAEEPHSTVKAFRCVGERTADIVGYLRREGVDVCYDIVPGNHYQHAQARLEKAFAWLFGRQATTCTA